MDHYHEFIVDRIVYHVGQSFSLRLSVATSDHCFQKAKENQIVLVLSFGHPFRESDSDPYIIILSC